MINYLPQKIIVNDTLYKSSIISGLIVLILMVYYLFCPAMGYSTFNQISAIIGMFPAIVTALIFLQTREIGLGIFFLTIYQTWNMFLSPFLGDQQYTATMRIVNPNYLSAMALVCCLSLFALFFGFIFASYRLKTKSFWNPTFMDDNNVKKSLIISICGGWILALASTILSIFGIQISFISSIDSMLPAVVASLLMMYYLRNGRNFILYFISIAYLIASFIYSVGGTLFINIIILLLGPTITYINETKKIPYLSIIAIVIFLLPIFVSRHDYRNVGLYLSGRQKYELGIKIIHDNYSNFSLAALKDITKDDSKNSYHDNRFEGVTYLGQVVHCHEDLGYSYNYGKTFMWLPTMFLPRMFIPMRPGQNMGDDWAEYYGLKDKSWNCSINFPMLVEFYSNFGWLGMILLSWMNGFAIYWVMSLFSFGKGDVNLLLLLFISLKLIVVEANITLNYGLILQVLFICWIIKKIQNKKETAL